jgi:hypothetical protein
MGDCNIYINCDNKNEHVESLFKDIIAEKEDGSLAVRTCCVTGACTPYVDCDHESVETLFKKLIVTAEDGTKSLRVNCCKPAVEPPPEPTEEALELTWDDIANVPVTTATSVSDWNTFFFGSPADPLLYTTAFTSVTVAGNVVKLYGGAGINIKDSLFYWDQVGTNVLEHCTAFEDKAGSIVSAGVLSFKNAFYNNTDLTLFALPALTTAGDYCFEECFYSNTAMTSFALPALTTAGLDCFYECFYSNTAMTSFALPALTTAGLDCFYECFYSNTAMTSFALPALTTAGLDCFMYCFYSNTAMTSFALPALTTAGDYCFYECFYSNTVLSALSLPLCTALGTTTGDDNVFNTFSSTSLTITLTIPHALMTCNGGAPDGDIQYLQANNTVTIVYSD